MEKEVKKNVVKKVVDDMKTHAKNQHQITKARHDISVKTPADAKAEFKERHEYAKLSPTEKQKLELEKLQSQKKK